jgi:serine/threonine-protein kinase RsbW
VRPFEIRVEPDLGTLAALRRRLGATLEGKGMSDPPRAAVILATHEAVVNAIQHAGPTDIVVRGHAEDGRFTIEITDDGQWKIPNDPPSDERGLGLSIIRQLVSDVEISRGTRGTTVRLTQHLE